MNLLYALIASVIVSLISLIGVFALIIRDSLLKKLIIFLVAFAAGGLNSFARPRRARNVFMYPAAELSIGRFRNGWGHETHGGFVWAECG